MLYMTTFLWENSLIKQILFIVLQVLCTLQITPAEVSGLQESNKKRTDGGTGERGIHESGEAKVGSSKLFWSSFLFIFF